jgi:plastocyanin
MLKMRTLFVVLALVAVGAIILTASSRFMPSAEAATGGRMVMVPGEDRFTPFAVTIHVGQSIQFVNNDTDSHYVVSNDTFNTAGNKGTNHLLTAGSKFNLTFNQTGVFPFYCSFHSKLDADSQPIAPGPAGGIQDSNGNYGTPMNGVVTVVP